MPSPIEDMFRIIFERADWMDRALCKGLDPELFYPPRGDPGYYAISICNQCPVREQCLQYALDNNEYHGVWGGTNRRQRQALMNAGRHYGRNIQTAYGTKDARYPTEGERYDAHGV